MNIKELEARIKKADPDEFFQKRLEWEKEEVEKLKEKSDPGALATFAEGAKDWFSRGMIDELAGNLEAIGQEHLGLKGLGSRSMSNIEKMTPEEKKNFVYDYVRDKRIKDRRLESQFAQSQRPGEFAGGQIIAAIVDPINKIIPGASSTAQKATKTATKLPISTKVANYVKGAVKPSALKANAADAALYGYGSSTEEDLKGQMKDAATGAGISAGMGKMISGFSAMARKTPKFFAHVIGDIAPDISDRILKDPTILDNPKQLDALSEELVKRVNSLSDQISKLDDIANKKLPNVKQFSGKRIKEHLNGVIVESGLEDHVGLPKVDEALKSVDQIMDAINDNKAYSPLELKRKLQLIRKSINWRDQEKQLANELMKKAQHAIDDLIKTKNPEYKKAMIPVADAKQKWENMRKAFNMERRLNDQNKLDLTDTSVNKLHTLSTDMVKPLKEQQKPIMEKRVKESLGDDFLRDVEKRGINQRMQADQTRGSKGAFGGGALGVGLSAATGLPTDKAVLAGAGLGYTKDKMGRRAASNLLRKQAGLRKFLDKYQSIPETYKAVLQPARDRGIPALIMRHQTLLEEDPSYADWYYSQQ